jgi:DNA-binding response OmpR family regulator
MALILLVDDDEAARGVIEALLKYEGHEVVLAANGTQALFMVKERTPDIVLSDIHMPGMSGIDFCKELRKSPLLRDTYCILATGFDTPEVKTQGIASGADDFIGKPIRADELNARVRMGLRIRGLNREAGDLRKKIQESEKARAELEQVKARITKLRGDLTASLGSVLDAARKAAETSRQGDVKASFASIERLATEIEGLRDRVAPREGS